LAEAVFEGNIGGGFNLAEQRPQLHEPLLENLKDVLTRLKELAKEVSLRGVAAYLSHSSGGLRSADAVKVLTCTEGLSRAIGVATGIVETLLNGSLEWGDAANMLEGVREGLRVVSCPESESTLYLKAYSLVNEALRCLEGLKVRNEYGSMLVAGMAAALAAKVIEGGEEAENAIV